jgi:hypothetical protein
MLKSAQWSLLLGRSLLFSCELWCLWGPPGSRRAAQNGHFSACLACCPVYTYTTMQGLLSQPTSPSFMYVAMLHVSVCTQWCDTSSTLGSMDPSFCLRCGLQVSFHRQLYASHCLQARHGHQWTGQLDDGDPTRHQSGAGGLLMDR